MKLYYWFSQARADRHKKWGEKPRYVTINGRKVQYTNSTPDHRPPFEGCDYVYLGCVEEAKK